MDQSTQVNFSTSFKNVSKKIIQRHHTTMDFPVTSSKSSPNRPKSINIPSDVFNRNKTGHSTPKVELTLNLAQPENTPSYSSVSSAASGYGNYQQLHRLSPHINRNLLPMYSSQYKTEFSAYGECKCFNNTVHSNDTKLSVPTQEGLSWRRLHMSRAKLKATSTTSELLSGFAMVAMVELQINEDTQVPEWLFVMFSVCTTILVAVHIFALMISTYILPNIDAISKLDVCELVAESPHERMKFFIELAWAFSTVLGLFLFLVEVAILCWVKFWDYSFTAAIAATVIVIPVLIIFVLFAVHFYHSLVEHRYDTSLSDLQNLEDMKKQLDQVVSPV